MDIEHPAIKDTLKTLDIAALGPIERAVKIFYFVRDCCHYNMHAITGDFEAYRASEVLKKGEGWCMQKAVLFTTLARAAGIPSRLVLVSIRNHSIPPENLAMDTNLIFPHAFNDLFLNGRWVKAAATFDAKICNNIKVAAVEFDGQQDALLPATDLEGRPYIEYLDEFGTHADIPWPLILHHLQKIYGPNFKRWLGSGTAE
jgi:transglutaminase-like putative cysteine protease